MKLQIRNIMPKVSVIMSVYNGEEHLALSIESILNQTHAEIEFIIIDDGSTDSSSEIIQKYKSIDNRIKYIKQDNVGLTKALNKALSYCTGEYIARQDADDISMPDRIARQVFYIENIGLDIVFCRAVSIFNDKIRYSPSMNNISNFSYRKLAFGNMFVHGTFLVRANILINEKYNEYYKYAQDYELFLRLISSGKKILIMSEPLYFLRLSDNSISSTKINEQNYYAARACRHYFGTSIFYMPDKKVIFRLVLKLLRRLV